MEWHIIASSFSCPITEAFKIWWYLYRWVSSLVSLSVNGDNNVQITWLFYQADGHSKVGERLFQFLVEQNAAGIIMMCNWRKLDSFLQTIQLIIQGPFSVVEGKHLFTSTKLYRTEADLDTEAFCLSIHKVQQGQWQFKVHHTLPTRIPQP